MCMATVKPKKPFYGSVNSIVDIYYVPTFTESGIALVCHWVLLQILGHASTEIYFQLVDLVQTFFYFQQNSLFKSQEFSSSLSNWNFPNSLLTTVHQCF